MSSPKPRRPLPSLMALIVAATLVLGASPALAADEDIVEMNGPRRVLQLAIKTGDLLVVRPISLGYAAVGGAYWAAGALWVGIMRTVPTGWTGDEAQTGYLDELTDNFVRIPGQFVFQRDLGDFSDGLGPG